MLELTPTPQDQNSFLEKEVKSTAFGFFPWCMFFVSLCVCFVVVVVLFFTKLDVS